MRVLLTGATGFIGAHVLQKLLAQGYLVSVLSRSPVPEAISITNGVSVFKGDILNYQTLLPAMQNCDAVLHLASLATVWSPDMDDFYRVNVTGTGNILQAASETGIKKCVIAGSAAIYGPSGNDIITEKTIRNFDIKTEYEASKAEMEKVVDVWVNMGLHACVVQPTRVFGEYLYSKPASVSLLIKKYVCGNWRFIPGNGKQTGNYVYVKDVAAGIILAMHHGVSGERYILGGHNCSYNTFFEYLAEISGIKRKMIHIPFGVQWFIAQLQLLKTLIGKQPDITPKWLYKSTENFNASSDKAMKLLGYQPSEFKTTLKATINWYKRTCQS